MNTDNTKSRSILFTAIAACVFFLAGCSSSDDGAVQTTDDTTGQTVTVSGVITNTEGTAPLPDVNVEAVYNAPGDAANPSTTTSATGAFSLEVLIQDFFLHGTKAGYVTINSEKDTAPVDVTDLDIGIPTVDEAQFIIDTAFGASTTALQNKAWLVVDIEDGNGDEVNGVSVSSSPAPAAVVYTNCDGTDSGGSVTADAPCTEDRLGPMYIAYFDAPAEASVTVSGDTDIAPLRMGEVTFLDFEVGNELPVAVNDAFNVVQGVTTNLNVAANDSDADDGLDLTSISIIATAANGTVTPNSNGTVDYAHNGSATLGDSFSYAIRDNSGAVSTTAVVTLTVFGTVSAGATKYDNDCSRCHAAGTHDPVAEAASDLYNDGEKLELDMTSINSMGGDAIISPQELIDLRAFLEDPSTNM